MRHIVVEKAWRKAVPLALAALLMLGGCDEEEEKNPEVEVHVPKGVDIKVKRIDEDDSEMIIVGELALFTTLIVWALFGPGATRRREEPASENG
jgi:hypothetical protein